jgi:glucosamine--fructose-6-phosphate aminotransferase (isomerizing)
MLAGELKHGPLALVDETMPVVLICVRDRCFDKTMNAFAQLLARKVRGERQTPVG